MKYVRQSSNVECSFDNSATRVHETSSLLREHNRDRELFEQSHYARGRELGVGNRVPDRRPRGQDGGQRSGRHDHRQHRQTPQTDGRRRLAVRERPVARAPVRCHFRPAQRLYFNVKQRRQQKHQRAGQQRPDQAHQQIESGDRLSHGHRRHYDGRP